MAPFLLVEHASMAPMDFIERYLGFSRDGGDGSIELTVLIGLIALVAAEPLRFVVVKI